MFWTFKFSSDINILAFSGYTTVWATFFKTLAIFSNHLVTLEEEKFLDSVCLFFSKTFFLHSLLIIYKFLAQIFLLHPHFLNKAVKQAPMLPRP
jgi:hypothetical protein